MPLAKTAHALDIRHAIESGDLTRAIQIQRLLFPPDPRPLMHETDEGDLREYLETPLPVFCFCSDSDLRELRVRMAVAICLRTRVERALEPDPSFPWPYRMSPKAAAQNFAKTVAIHRNVSGWLKSGLVQAAKILSSADGPCSACETAAREYAIHDLPQLPLHNCGNLNTVGCRCSVVATKILGLSQKW
jgi:hypothetical protein